MQLDDIAVSEDIVPLHALAVKSSRTPELGVLELRDKVLMDLLGKVEDRAPSLEDYRGARVCLAARTFGVDAQDVEEREELLPQPFHLCALFRGYCDGRKSFAVAFFKDHGVLPCRRQIPFVSHEQIALDEGAGLGIPFRIPLEDDALPSQHLADGLQH